MKNYIFILKNNIKIYLNFKFFFDKIKNNFNNDLIN